MAKKDDVLTIDIPNFTITAPALYLVEIKGLNSLLMNKMPDLSVPKTKKSSQVKIDPTENEQNTWREKAYCDETGDVHIPGENIHECMKEAAKYWGQRIPGEGQKTYTDVVTKAIVCENLSLGINKDSNKLIPLGKAVNGNPSKGKRSGAKVYKIRPLVHSWGGTFRMHVFDGRMSIEVLRVILTYAGTFIGLCDWRPTYGRFELVNIKEVE
jgi:hypothetical protein